MKRRERLIALTILLAALATVGVGLGIVVVPRIVQARRARERLMVEAAKGGDRGGQGTVSINVRSVAFSKMVGALGRTADLMIDTGDASGEPIDAMLDDVPIIAATDVLCLRRGYVLSQEKSGWRIEKLATTLDAASRRTLRAELLQVAPRTPRAIQLAVALEVLDQTTADQLDPEVFERARKAVDEELRQSGTAGGGG